MLEPTAIALKPANEFLSYVQSHTGERITACYQCGKCSAGCPTAYAMDLTPIVEDPSTDIQDYVQGFVGRFGRDIRDRIARSTA